MKIKSISAAILTFTLVLFMAQSCSDDLLNQTNTNTVSTGTFWQTEEDAKTAVNGMFHPITNTFFWGRIIHTGALLRSDVYNVRPFDNNTPLSTLQGVPGSSRWALEVWQEPFKAIGRANAILENLGTDVPNAEAYIGQAYFMRAFANFYLVNLFRNVPLVTKTPTTEEEFFPSQADPALVWQQIIDDLGQAESRLPASWDGQDLGRPTSGAASAFKGKAHLYIGQWAEAEAAFNTVISSGRYDLLPADQFTDNFGQTNENNVESVFELQFLGIDAFSWGVDVPGVGSMGNFHLDYSPPSKSLDQSHYINTWVKDLYESNGDVVRRNATLTYDYPGATGYGGVPFVDDLAADIALAANENMEPIFSRKYTGMDIGTRDMVDDLGTNVGNNWRVIRYADVLLMMAEAINEQNRPGDAETYINEVRERAQVAEYSGLSQAEMTQAIIDERVMELTGEGHRFFDLVRWELADDYMGANSLHGSNPKSISGGTFDVGRDEYIWIPVSEISANSNLVQNPGY